MSTAMERIDPHFLIDLKIWIEYNKAILNADGF
jgi:hypothetical protein